MMGALLVYETRAKVQMEEGRGGGESVREIQRA